MLLNGRNGSDSSESNATSIDVFGDVEIKPIYKSGARNGWSMPPSGDSVSPLGQVDAYVDQLEDLKSHVLGSVLKYATKHPRIDPPAPLRHREARQLGADPTAQLVYPGGVNDFHVSTQSRDAEFYVGINLRLIT